MNTYLDCIALIWRNTKSRRNIPLPSAHICLICKCVCRKQKTRSPKQQSPCRVLSLSCFLDSAYFAGRYYSNASLSSCRICAGVAISCSSSNACRSRSMCMCLCSHVDISFNRILRIYLTSSTV